MKPPFYNTNKESGGTLIRSIKKAQSEQEMVLFLLQIYANNPLTPPEVEMLFEAHYHRKIHFGNVKRILTNLTADGKIVKNENIDDMREGKYGKQNHTWVYIPEKRRVQQGVFNF